jgi:hypothetical protein
MWLHVQVREVRCHYTTATGPCAARSMAQQLWGGEEYLLQLDAHMRFVQVRQRCAVATLTRLYVEFSLLQPPVTVQ